MTNYALLGVALLATTLVSHVHAQPVVEDPSYCAEFYPHTTCRNLGPGNPYTDGGNYRLAAKLFHEKIRAFEFPETEDLVPLPLPSDAMTVP
jgi:hypothetical protein